MTTLSMGAGFIIAIVAIIVLAVLIGTVYFANWQQDRDFARWRQQKADRAANPQLAGPGEPRAELEESGRAG